MNKKVAAIIVGAGRGTRAGGDIPKQYRSLAGVPVFLRTLQKFATHPEVDVVQPVIREDDTRRYLALQPHPVTLAPALGGETRQHSVLAGLLALIPEAPDIVLVHDAARPFASAALISRAIAAAGRADAAVPAHAVVDAMVSVSADGELIAPLDRSTLRTIQTPQAFRFIPFLEAHRKAADAHRSDFPDDGSLAQWAGLSVRLFDGETANVKLTTLDDLMRAELALRGDVRIGSGYDVHAFGPGDAVMLGGIAIAHDRGLAGHSDADVALHALTDAVLGALADGDIGQHFPNSDPQWRGAPSDRFLAYACTRARARGALVAHLDLTIICEAPAIGPHRDAMRTRIAQIAELSIDRVAVKATTNEKLGFLGRGEGIAAFATATLNLPWSDRDE